ncbi:GNAT family N-acetyltransferase [Pseudonocardia sp. DSM 110487]|uniref:GNAT family N-acetyltransferase n=1 Tax=Pseudonocardia sp. DSM 110487 TaxID=2865833 RepID=UPI001C699BA5|nr:GNAT family N-acetyltransferase [Pseudonocardia sp. DSM 110487]QYN33427.1 GNAT family N-acetyltransferase [Pseudonocardia sp. DSM 110487]
MEIALHDDAGEFAAAAGPLLQADPLRHTMALTALDGMHRGGEPSAVLLTVREAGEVTGAALRSPGRATLVSAVPARHAPAVERALAEADPIADGAHGPVAEAEAFAAARIARTGCRAEPAMRTRLFALNLLAPPRGVPGRARRADEGDIPLLGEWRRAFGAEAGHDKEHDPEGLVARSLRLGAGEMLWEVDGTPVAQACAKPVIARMSRIGPVYTPPEHRGHGYAAAVTAAASQWALDAGAQRVVLFTDLANPTTNRLYPRIGYRPVHDAVELRFIA